MEDVLGFIEELEEELIGSRNALFSKKSKVDAEKCLQVLSELKAALPDTVREAQAIVDNRQKQLEQTDAECQRILKDAQIRATEIMSESTILKKAEAEARAIRNEALQYNDTLRSRAKEYVDDLFTDMEKFLVDTLTMIRNNREELRGSIIKDKKDD